jgi:DNA-binding NarL/FixJ family response regulator
MSIMQPEEKVLSERELEVLELIACGCKNCEIALALEIEVRTVRFHVENIFDKLRVKNRTEAASYTYRNGWITE